MNYIAHQRCTGEFEKTFDRLPDLIEKEWCAVLKRIELIGNETGGRMASNYR